MPCATLLFRRGLCLFLLLWPLSGLPVSADSSDLIDLSSATIVVRGEPREAGERVASQVLQEELEARLGARLPISTAWPGTAPVTIVVAAGLRPGSSIAVAWCTGGAAGPAWRSGPGGISARGVQLRAVATVVWILGADGRGALFGVGHLLRATPLGARRLRGPVRAGCPPRSRVVSTPAYAIRGHQLGYRQHSNTYDAWDEARYDRYIRDLALFGANSIENIPLQDTRVSPHFRLPRDQMNVAISRVCARYDLDYWIWVPADFDLADAARRAEALATLEAMFASDAAGWMRSSFRAATPVTTRRNWCCHICRTWRRDCRSTTRAPRSGSRCNGFRRRRWTGSTNR